jgi:Uma2 family endonuclease
MATAAALPICDEVEYPHSDGQPMAESDPHCDEMIYLREGLRHHFRDRPDVYVSGNLFLYYEQGKPSAVVAPDVMVVRGVAPGSRRKYLLWEEGVSPCLVVEVTSRSTRHEDEAKKDLYARLGVDEYFRFDPHGEYLHPRLQGFRRRGAGYRRLQPTVDGGLRSRSLRLTFSVEGSRLRVADTVTGRRLLRFEEAMEAERAAESELVVQAARAAQKAVIAAREAAARRASDERAALEAARADELEREVARLRQELDRLSTG